LSLQPRDVPRPVPPRQKPADPNERGRRLATGEFILGHVNEAQELPPTAPPWWFVRNGTFMAYRKLHENVGSFRAYIDQQAEQFQRLGGAPTPEAARETLKVKMVGRWTSGIPLAIAPTRTDAEAIASQWEDIPLLQAKGAHRRTEAESARLLAYEQLLTNFRYAGDEQGARCPVAAHTRRTNPRDAMDPLFGTKGNAAGSALTNRRRILRRGMPYGDSTLGDDAGEHGVVFLAICGSLFRQFEFVQQQWVQCGSSFGMGNDTDPLLGNHGPGAKFVIAADPKKSDAPFICPNLPQFVETRGGEYFFLPSLTALRQIAQGSVDPT
jgi:Dyp-type peroxidase family